MLSIVFLNSIPPLPLVLYNDIIKSAKEGSLMKKNTTYAYRLKLTDFELRVMVNSLNETRLKMKDCGEDPTDVSDLILRFLDILDS